MTEPDIDGIEIEDRESGGHVVTAQIWPDGNRRHRIARACATLRHHLPTRRGGRHRPDGAYHPRSDPPPSSAAAMRVTATQTQTGRKQQDRFARRAEKWDRQVRMTRIYSLIRTVPAASEAMCASMAAKCLICAPDQATLTTNGMLFGGCRLWKVNMKKINTLALATAVFVSVAASAASAAPIVEVDGNPSWDFGGVTIGSSETRTFHFEAAPSSAYISRFEVSYIYPHGVDFTIYSPPSSSYTRDSIVIKFAPTLVRNYDEVLEVEFLINRYYENCDFDRCSIESWSERDEHYFSLKAEGLDPTPSPSPVPLPAGLPLLLAGIGGMGLMARKKSGRPQV